MRGLHIRAVKGALAIAVANPTDLVKLRPQSEGKLAPGRGCCFVRTDVGLNVGHEAIINASELFSYDQVKQSLSNFLGSKTTSSLISSLVWVLNSLLFMLVLRSTW
ncbi:hypothetical protein TRIUR3_28247 [Triticum urartu]|uniref:Uncharacterized protein n=1 Tax=Triticum urartu TaxID=4572 RepID=M7ZF21_TRIUA|nr:hypothetical protein TRIUR3_28247 [Triticum urartu]